jgi:hypothetical protein
MSNITNTNLDKYTSLSVEFKNHKNRETMRFNLADDNGYSTHYYEWFPTKEAIHRLIKVLQDVELQMTDMTNS